MSKMMCLCEGRHSIPYAVDGAIFPNELNPLDLQGMENICAEKLEGVEVLTLFVTGLTVALVTVINYCHENNVALMLMHYDREQNGYYGQIVK